jgi:hypothetical protein
MDSLPETDIDPSTSPSTFSDCPSEITISPPVYSLASDTLLRGLMILIKRHTARANGSLFIRKDSP